VRESSVRAAVADDEEPEEEEPEPPLAAEANTMLASKIVGCRGS
jgi:hypothetical protein